MQQKHFLLSFSVLVLSVVLYKYLKIDLIKYCEREKCPYCYGTDLCEFFTNNTVNIVDETFTKFFTNRFSVKNVIYAELFGENVVLKKLVHTKQLLEFDELICTDNKLGKGCNISLVNDYHNYTDKILEVLNTKNRQLAAFKLCSEKGANVFAYEIFSKYKTPEELKHVWTALKLNVEPLLLEILLSDYANWPVPRYLGACGRLTVQTDCGTPINALENANWFKRARIAHQLLVAAKNFTFDHDKFRFYFTDISPDNIVVSSEIKLSFIDLENVILSLKTEGNGVHYSINFGEKLAVFIYSEDEICSSSISDHNFFAICKLLLSPHAPWPMMDGGLLHSVPSNISTKKLLFDKINLCVNPKDAVTRFIIAEDILEILEDILYIHRL